MQRFAKQVRLKVLLVVDFFSIHSTITYQQLIVNNINNKYF